MNRSNDGEGCQAILRIACIWPRRIMRATMLAFEGLFSNFRK